MTYNIHKKLPSSFRVICFQTSSDILTETSSQLDYRIFWEAKVSSYLSERPFRNPAFLRILFPFKGNHLTMFIGFLRGEGVTGEP